ncbi:MAG: cysteine--tRNA ligase [Candidatus Magasanikbacteria bacterium]|uniref:Cysteine--tRNA ligase n=1 Tax=Candidatus Magasanikbacteria bacterium CG10_big_fil_rev_8_21_14_0_10_38_6 TaxID=1974647 RepID=A0A2M6P1C5_9BACT|nr:cysteine--tRNA ligase [Candidatus Magasanikbacteria bacterium]PIR77497.1 MAG: cysteine--tRNA ligase [Candidatus Magasanikbacteria bacterium CG10_big_fil_rev_8_21_14_0_10_38_6]
MITLFNTLSRKKELFASITPQTIGVYTCGPTVYHYVHIGNLRTYVFEDVLVRTLRHAGYTVKHVMNITDVGHLTDDADAGEDKMEKGSRREGNTAWEVAAFYTEAFMHDMKQLNLTEPTIWCKATDHIQEQIDQVQTLIDTGYTYETKDGIYFNTAACDNYGALANLQNQELQAGSRVDMGEKKHAHDFALWKFSQPGEHRQMEWDAFGKKGFPGWHIECSAMAMKYLGTHIDIHCGGIDHIPVHHTNEIAQAECAGAHHPWVNVWMHGEFLVVPSGKMSKSDDNFLTLETLFTKGIDPLAYRYFLLQAHYRKQLTFTWEALEAATNGLKNLKKQIAAIDENIVDDESTTDAFFTAVYDDLNTPEALAVLWTGLKQGTVSRNMIKQFDDVLGLNLLTTDSPIPHDISEHVQALLDARAEARKNKDWGTSDALRDEIHALGFEIEDTSDGQALSR